MTASVRLPPRGVDGFAQRTCAHCRFFASDPLILEASISGLRSMGSGFASVRGDDGLCSRHQRYLSANASCAEFQQGDSSARS